MVTSVNARTGWGLDGPTVAAQDVRLQLASSFLTGAASAGAGTTGIAARQGTRPGLGSPLLVVAASGMNVTVNAGTAFLQGTAAINSGMYTACLDSNATLTVSAANVTNPRIDNVIARVVDNGNNTSTTTVELTTGTAAPSPTAPSLPANSLLLAQIAVAANASSITSANITDKRVFTAATGGVIPVRTAADQPQATSEFPAYRHRLDVGTGLSSPLEWSINGSLWTPVGAMAGMLTLATSGSHPSSPSSGLSIYETDTQKVLVWNGAAWAGVYESGAYGTWTDMVLGSNWTAVNTPQYRTAPGGMIQLRGSAHTTTTVATSDHIWASGAPVPAAGGRIMPLAIGLQAAYLDISVSGFGFIVFSGSNLPNDTVVGFDGLSYNIQA